MKPTKKKKNAAPAPISQLEVLSDRLKLREYCNQNNIKTPDYFASEQFLKISQWAMKKNTFPLCLKTSKNLTKNHFFYILRAFRELPEFFELIQAKNNNEKVIIEEFIEGKAYLEVTFLDKEIRLISQINLNKAMKLQQKWRAFPIKLPNNIFDKIKDITSFFNQLIEENASEPLRFSFVIKNAEPILLSINKGNDRLEYMDSWRERAGLTHLKDSHYPYEPQKISKINIYKLQKEVTYDFSETVKVCEKSDVKYEIIENKLYFMLTNNDPSNLAEDFEKANAVIKQIIG